MSDEILDEAIAALRDLDADDLGDGALDPGDDADAEATLAGVLAALAADDHSLDASIDALRLEEAQLDGAARASNDPTLERVLTSLAADKPAARSRLPWAAAALVGLALLLGGPTAWAWSTGRIAAVVRALSGEPSVEPARVAPSARTAEPRRRAPQAPPTDEAPTDEAPTDEAPTLEAPPGEAPPAPLPESPSVPLARRSAPRRAPEEATQEPDLVAAVEPAPAEPGDDDPTAREDAALFEVAHRAHFGAGGPNAALRGWDAYLARFPRGRFAPEARYNRAITLVRLGRAREARRALRPFADAAPGGYRQAEAQRLREALAPLAAESTQ